MTRYTIVKLIFHSPLHIGKGLGDAYDTAEKALHSDTISGALTAAYCMLFPGEDPLRFMNCYKLSSAFPFYSCNFFLPKPLTKINIHFSEGEEYEYKKKLKKIEYIEIPLWQKLVSGYPLEVKRENLSLNGRFLYLGEAPPIEPFKDELHQRVTVPRNGGDTVPYYLDRRFFAENAGLFFILETDGNSLEIIKKSLDYLKDIGFGTDKSVGNGQFHYEISSIEIELPPSYSRQMLLSLSCPELNDISVEILKASTYLLMKRGGFIAGTTINHFRHLRKKSLYMFVEGSVFPARNFSGKIENVRPEWNDEELHPVYRDGRAFLFPVNI